MKNTNEYKQPNFTKNIFIVGCLSAIIGLAGCEKEGTAEKAGKKIDRAAENVEHNLEQFAGDTDKKIEAAKDSLDQKAEKAGELIDKSTTASKEAVEQAGKDLEGAKESVIESSATTGEYIDDSVITLKVKAAILNDPMFKGSQSQISVTTLNGVVKLSGTVDSEPSIGRAIKLAGSQSNVKSVETELTVNTNESGK
jgi:hyperosmotically inducible periplasmic protein